MSRQDNEAPLDIIRVQRMAAILAATLAGDENALAAIRAGEIHFPVVPPGVSPASKESLEAMPRIVVADGDEIKECAICLEEMRVGAEIRAMPCQHGYHCVCIEKWLSGRDSCPVCRYKLPAAGLGEEGGDEGVVEVEVVVSTVLEMENLELGEDQQPDPDDNDDDDDDGYEYDRMEDLD